MKNIGNKMIGAAAALMMIFLLLPSAALSERAPGGMFELYEMNRKNNIPNYITEDFVLLAYSMLLNGSVTDVEQAILYPEFKGLVEGMREKLSAEENRDEAADAALDFLTVISCLLSEEGNCPADQASHPEKVAKELEKIRNGKAIEPSDLMAQTIDYTQFKVRGKYTRTPDLGRYFQGMRYAGTVLFPVLESKATGITADAADGLTRQALVLVRLLHDNEDLLKRRQLLEDRMAWLFGHPDDLTHDDYQQIAEEKGYASTAQIRQALLEHAKKTGRQPEIIGGLVMKGALEKGIRPKDVMTGWRFLPQRFRPDSAAFQSLVYDSVGEYQGEKKPFTLSLIEGKPVKGFPLGLELMALLGSAQAEAILEKNDERNYKGYDQAADDVRDLFQRALNNSGRVSDHLGILRYWLTRSHLFSEAKDAQRRLNTALAFWTWDRYISVLYAKQSYTVGGKGLPAMSGQGRSAAWITPAPELYLYLSREADKLAGHLQDVPPAAAGIVNRLQRFSDLMEKCRIIAETELQGRKIRPVDIDFLNRLDEAFLKLTGENDSPVIVDVHTEPTSAQALQEGIGLPRIIEKDLDGEKARGALFTYYEFKHPMSDRLTDKEWLEILNDPEKMKKLPLSPGSSQRE